MDGDEMQALADGRQVLTEVVDRKAAAAREGHLETTRARHRVAREVDLSCASRGGNSKQRRQTHRPGRRPQSRGQAGQCAATRAVRYLDCGLCSEWFPWRGSLATTGVAAMSPGARSTVAHTRPPGLAPPGPRQVCLYATPCPRARGTVAQDLAGHLRAFERLLPSRRTHLRARNLGTVRPEALVRLPPAAAPFPLASSDWEDGSRYHATRTPQDRIWDATAGEACR